MIRDKELFSLKWSNKPRILKKDPLKKRLPLYPLPVNFFQDVEELVKIKK